MRTLKKTMSMMLVCAALLLVFAGGKTHAEENPENKAVLETVEEYFTMREVLLRENDVDALEGIAVAGITEDEKKHLELEEITFGASFVLSDIRVGETEAEVWCNENTASGDVEHQLTLFPKINGGWLVVSDGYLNQFDGFRSASYVDWEWIAQCEKQGEIGTGKSDDIQTGGTNLKTAFLNKAYGEVGYLEKASNYNLYSHTGNPGHANYTKYGAWAGHNPDEWCAMFVYWCARQSGVTSDIIPNMISVANGISGFTALGQYRAVSTGYSPKSGDIFFMKIPDVISHTGIVYSIISGGYLQIIDGNGGGNGSTQYDRVRIRTISATDTNLTGYGLPVFINNGASPDANTGHVDVNKGLTSNQYKLK